MRTEDRRLPGRFQYILPVIAALALPAAMDAAAPDCKLHGRGSGSSEDPFIVPRTSHPIVIDAVLDEAAWSEAPPCPPVC